MAQRHSLAMEIGFLARRMRWPWWRLLAYREQRRFLCSQSLVIPAVANSRELLASKCDYVKALYGFLGDREASVGDYRSKQAARVALQNFLHFRRGLPLDDAVLISENAPRYVHSLLERLQEQLPEGSSGSSSISYEHLRKGMEELLQREGVDEMEPFLESIGAQQHSTASTLTGDKGLLRTAKALEEVGISRKTFWKLVAHNPAGLLNYTLRDCMDTVGILHSLGIARSDMDRALLQCPAAFRVELEEELRPCVQQLERLGLNKSVIGDIVLAAPSKLQVLKQVNMEALVFGMAREVGLPLEECSRLIRENPLLIVGTSLAKVAQLVSYLSKTLLLEDHEVAALVKRYPRILALNLHKSVASKVEYLRQQLCIKRHVVKRAIVEHPEALAFSLEANLKPKVAFLENIGFDRFSLGALLDKYPQLLLDLMANDVKRKANYLVSCGLKEVDLAGVLNTYPQFIRLSLQDVQRPLSYLRKLGADAATVGTMLFQEPRVLGYDERSTMRPAAEYLSSLRLSRGAIVALLRRKPALLGMPVEALAEKVDYFEGLGFKRTSEAFATALVMCCRVPISFMDGRLDALRGVSGLSEEQVLALAQVQVALLCRNEEGSIHRIDYYVNVMKLPVCDLVRFPHLLNFDLERTLKPRHRLISWLKSQNIVRRDYPWSYLNMPKREFEDTFAECHPQARDVYNGNLPQLLLLQA